MDKSSSRRMTLRAALQQPHALFMRRGWRKPLKGTAAAKVGCVLSISWCAHSHVLFCIICEMSNLSWDLWLSSTRSVIVLQVRQMDDSLQVSDPLPRGHDSAQTEDFDSPVLRKSLRVIANAEANRTVKQFLIWSYWMKRV